MKAPGMLEGITLAIGASLGGGNDAVLRYDGTSGAYLGTPLAPVNDMDAPSDILFVTIPEPATLSLLALGGLAMLRRRRGGLRAPVGPTRARRITFPEQRRAQ